MFIKQWIGALTLWLLLIGGCFWLLYSNSPDARVDYQRLMNRDDETNGSRLEERQSKQTRSGVSKQVLYNKDDKRLQIRLKSAESELVYSKDKGELVEYFKGLTCVMQDELIDEPFEEDEESLSSASVENVWQRVRQLKSEEAVYRYDNGKLEAEKVEIAHFVLPGGTCLLELDRERPLLKGKAKSLKISLFQENTAQAEGFEAIIHDWGGDSW